MKTKKISTEKKIEMIKSGAAYIADARTQAFQYFYIIGTTTQIKISDNDVWHKLQIAQLEHDTKNK